MLSTLLVAWALVVVTVTVHTIGLTLLIRILGRSHGHLPTRFLSITWLLIRMTWGLIVIHLIDISIWGLFYFWQGCMPDAESSFYFAGVTYTTIGYGELVLEVPWRMLAPVQGLTGILMCGLSAGVFFAVVSRLYMPHLEARGK